MVLSFFPVFFVLGKLLPFRVVTPSPSGFGLKMKNADWRNANRGCVGNIRIKKVSQSVGFVHKRRVFVPVTVRGTTTTTASTTIKKVVR